ncbi:hypothetical protein [Streptomyces californicus]|uniref:hypothetical protein n=1 Tax=Streptomyces californicus TaxID=67351 RepID=UPI0037B36C36
MGIADQFKDKARQLADQAEQKAGRGKGEAEGRASRGGGRKPDSSGVKGRAQEAADRARERFDR